MDSKLGERLREERERLGLSQAEFAEKVGVHRNTQVRYESGKRQPDSDYMAQIQDLGVDAGYLIFGRRTDPISIYSLAVASVLPKIAERVGLSVDALFELIQLAAEYESYLWGGDTACGGEPDITSLIDALFENGDLLSGIFSAVASVLHHDGLKLPCDKRARVVAMLYRTFRPTGNVDPAMVEEAVRLASS